MKTKQTKINKVNKQRESYTSSASPSSDRASTCRWICCGRPDCLQAHRKHGPNVILKDATWLCKQLSPRLRRSIDGGVWQHFEGRRKGRRGRAGRRRGGGERKRKRSAFKSKTRCGSKGRRGDDGEVGESEMVTVLFEGALIKWWRGRKEGGSRVGGNGRGREEETKRENNLTK